MGCCCRMSPADWLSALDVSMHCSPPLRHGHRRLLRPLPVAIQCLTTVVVEQFQPGPADIEALLLQQIQNLEEIFQVNRIRCADQRLLALLAWIGRRFGQVSSRGYRLSLKDMNLTHKSLADLCGLTRVPLANRLNRYKGEGVLQQISQDDLFIPSVALVPSLL